MDPTLFVPLIMGLFGGAIGAAATLYVWQMRRRSSFAKVERAVKDQREKQNQWPNGEATLKRLEIDRRAFEASITKKLDKCNDDLGALQKNVVGHIQNKCDSLEKDLTKLQADASTLAKRLDSIETRTAETKTAKPINAPASKLADAPSKQPEITLAETQTKPLASPTAVSVGEVDRRSVGEIIVNTFDDVDAKAMRRIDQMKLEYESRLGANLADLYEREGAYVFVMHDQDAFIHPRPNSPLSRVWERAFPGANSYSLPVKRVFKVAVVRQPNGEYEVLEKGEFQS